jgi:hypothetical protein
MNRSDVRELGRLFANRLLPYPDPLSRRRVRRLSRKLVDCEPWPGNGATSLQIAKLAMLRLLWLQRATRRAAWLRQRDATALLARAAIETCISSVYWLGTEDATARLTGDNAKSLQKMLKAGFRNTPLTPEIIRSLTSVLGTPAGLPALVDMATKTRDQFLIDVYGRLYVPLSTFSAHASGFAMLRHVDSNGKLLEKPSFTISLRILVHTTDACAARLAIALAERQGIDSSELVAYGNAHVHRTTHPLLSLAAAPTVRKTGPRGIIGVVRCVRAFRAYTKSPAFIEGSYEDRKAHAKAVMTELAGHLNLDVSEMGYGDALDAFARDLARGPDTD